MYRPLHNPSGVIGHTRAAGSAGRAAPRRPLLQMWQRPAWVHGVRCGLQSDDPLIGYYERESPMMTRHRRARGLLAPRFSRSWRGADVV